MNTLLIESKLANKFKYNKLPLELSEKYRKFFMDNIPSFLNINGSNNSIYTINGSIICNGYNRIVIGDYGAFIEFSKEQKGNIIFEIQIGEEYRYNDPKYSKTVKYGWLTIYDNSNIKIYEQLRKVSYADYKIGMYYVSPHEVFLK